MDDLEFSLVGEVGKLAPELRQHSPGRLAAETESSGPLVPRTLGQSTAFSPLREFSPFLSLDRSTNGPRIGGGQGPGVSETVPQLNTVVHDEYQSTVPCWT